MRMKRRTGEEVGETLTRHPENKIPPRPLFQPEGSGSAKARLILPLLAPVLFMLLIVPTGLLMETPGPSFDLQEGLSVQGADTYTSRGELLLTSVSLQESTLAYYLLSLFYEGFDIVKVRDYLGEELDTEAQDVIDIVITIISQDTAVVAGLQAVGIPVEVEGLGLFVVAVAPDYPAHGAIEPGEVIVSINGEPVDDMDRFTELIGSTPEGETVSLQVKGIDDEAAERVNERLEQGIEQRPDISTLLEDAPREVEVQPVYEPELERAIIGISAREFFTYSSSVEAEWDMESVKGPSAGLMMTLSLVNALTPDDLTRGQRIAGTGEINRDGDVGPIGGLTFKIRAAEREGAEVFIYPVENQGDLEGFSTDLQLFAVDDLDDALELLQALK